MSLPEVLYVDNYYSAYDFTVHQLTLNKGNQTCISKEKLTELAKANGITVYSGIKKRVLVIKLYDIMGNALLKYCKHTGVVAYSFMKKYRLLPGEVEDFAKAGLLEMTGELSVYRHGKSKSVNLYSAEQYFSLNDETISEWRKIVNGKKS